MLVMKYLIFLLLLSLVTSIFIQDESSVEDTNTHIVKLHRIQTPYSPDTDCVLSYKAIRSPYWENTGSIFGGVSRCDLCFPCYRKYKNIKNITCIYSSGF